jgi:hypothetical protein
MSSKYSKKRAGLEFTRLVGVAIRRAGKVRETLQAPVRAKSEEVQISST